MKISILRPLIVNFLTLDNIEHFELYSLHMRLDHSICNLKQKNPKITSSNLEYALKNNQFEKTSLHMKKLGMTINGQLGI